MNLSDLFIVCSHGRRSAHAFTGAGEGEWCPGGRPATLEDLGGEKVWWCDKHKTNCESEALPYEKCSASWRILIPFPQMVAE